MDEKPCTHCPHGRECSSATFLAIVFILVTVVAAANALVEKERIDRLERRVSRLEAAQKVR